MAIQLGPNESIVYPQPYEPSQYNPLIITNDRLIQVNEMGGVLNMDNKLVTGVGRGMDQRIVFICVLLAMIALPLAIYGIYSYKSADDVLAKYKEPPKPKLKTATPKEKAEIARYKAAKSDKTMSYVFMGIGALFGAATYFAWKKRFTVIIGGAGRTQTVKVKDKNQQSQIIMTIQAVVNSAKQTAATLAASQKPPPGRR